MNSYSFNGRVSNSVSGFHALILGWLGAQESERLFRARLRELASVAYKGGISALFPIFVISALAVTQWVSFPYLSRYDWLFLICFSMQVWVSYVGYESWRELAAMCSFHLLGLVLEIHKVSSGSWCYTESGLSVICAVPLYSGFMYASVASFLCLCWRHFRVRLLNWPSKWSAVFVAAGFYANFFWNHQIDIRYPLLVLAAVIYGRTWILIDTNGRTRRMPLVLAVVGLGFSIWVAENIVTYFGAWAYPYQRHQWSPVRFYIIGSWTLLIGVAITVVGFFKGTESA